MGTYTLNVNIDSGLASLMKNEGYKLCIAKKVNGQYTVVLSGATFSEWDESYQLFCSQRFLSGVIVEACTVSQDIAFGQACNLESNGALGPEYGPVDKSGLFVFNNEYGSINSTQSHVEVYPILSPILLR